MKARKTARRTRPSPQSARISRGSLRAPALKARLSEDRPLPVELAWVSLPAQWLMLYVDDVLLEAGP